MPRVLFLVVVLTLASCRPQQPQNDDATSDATLVRESLLAPVAPVFNNSPDGAARKFLYAWITGDDALLRDAILHDERYPMLFSLGWVAPDRRARLIDRVLNEPVTEFHPGDRFPVGLPGRTKRWRTVGDEGLEPDRKLLMLAERGLYAVHRDGRWIIDAGPIIDSFEQVLRPPPPASTQPASP
jgi:hypothetical protein